MTRPLAFGVVLVGVLVATSLLTGCSEIPDSGKVQTNSVTASTGDDPVIRVLPRKPVADATPTEIVAGFLTASASFDNDHAFARSYLTPAASQTWRPDSGVAVYDSDPGYRLTDDIAPGRVRMLALRSAGTISARGQFSQPAGSAQYRADFSVRKVGTQWRIAGLPDGLILSTGDISRAYRSVNMFFLDIAGGVLVPDPLFLPAQPGIATSLTRELLVGPTQWLLPAVRTAVPSGTRLAVDSVPIEDGIARVDLDRDAVAATGDDRRALAAQLSYTLAQLPDVRGVRITLNGVPFVVPGAGAVTSSTEWPTFDPDAPPADRSTYAIDQGHLATVASTSEAVPGFFGTAKNLLTAAVALDGRLTAGIVQNGAGTDVRFGASGAATAAVAYRGPRVSSVSFDRLNSAWIADRTNGTTKLSVLRSGRPAVVVPVQGLGTRSVEVLRISRDGARIALVLSPTAGASGQLFLGRIERASGVPTVAGLRRVENVLSEVTDVAWADDTTLLVVARRAAESVQSFLVGIDGDSVESAGSIPSLQSVAACPGRPNLAGTGAGTLWVDRGNGWRVFVTGTTPIYPG